MLLDVWEASERFSGIIKPRSLRDRRVRVRMGLPAVKIGGRLCFRSEDVDRIIRHGVERLTPDAIPTAEEQADHGD